ncbi:MAG: hypothetical protein JWM40_2966 [Frankiales bacterium]|nr:hypothetical protein [Frankiales bacterium]
MITVPLVVAAGLVGFQVGVFTEWRRVLRYLYRHLDRDPDWLRSGIALEHHTRRKAPTG